MTKSNFFKRLLPIFVAVLMVLPSVTAFASPVDSADGNNDGVTWEKVDNDIISGIPKVNKDENSDSDIDFISGNVRVSIVVDEKTIILNGSIKETCVGRYYFTLAHEVAHLILDMVYHLGYRVRYRSKPKVISNGSKYHSVDYEEHIADVLASYLLMPEVPLRLMFKESFKCSRVDIITSYEHSELYSKFCRIAEHFSVSREALSIRLQQTGMLGKYYSYQHQSKIDIFPVA